MRKSDIILILILIVANSVFLYNTVSFESADKANVFYENELVLEIDLTVDDSYIVDGVNGEVEITVKNGKVAITKETSPLNICSEQGYVNVNQIPLICLPNKVVVEGSDSEVDGVAR